MSNLISQIIKDLNGKKMLIPFFTAGYPALESTVKLAIMAQSCGCDMIELGMPFSDPLADGPEIQFSSKIALDNGITVKTILRQVSDIKARIKTPIILMGYYNPLIAYGEEKFLRDASSAGVDGLIIPDLPVDESARFHQTACVNNLSLTFLVSPTTTPERIKLIDRYSTNFVYAVTVTGVTGTGKVFDQKTDTYLKNMRLKLSKKFVAGFGVSSAESAKKLTTYADGVVIGSALIKILKNAPAKKQGMAQLETFLKKIRKAL